ncbi:unnamed protein product [Closterium sp. Naga37s-1]|nr:unnamed protein product [Closterium sp. Naga37s-1]
MALVSKVGGLLCVGILLLALALNPADAGMVAEIPVSKFGAGKACGTCYQVTCKNSKRCNKGASVTVRAMNNDGDGFTLNNPAWDKIVRDRSGSVEVEYRSVDCPTNGRGMAVMIERSSGPYYFALYVLGAARNAAVGKVELSTDGNKWTGMTRGGWGARWELPSAKDVVGAGRKVSVRVTAAVTQQQVVLQDVIPSKWSAGKTYESSSNF